MCSVEAPKSAAMEQESAASMPMTKLEMRRAAKALAKPGLNPDLVQHSMALAGRRSSSTKDSQGPQIVEAEINTVALSTPLTEAVKAPSNTVAADR